jgi:hypothetical protein
VGRDPGRLRAGCNLDEGPEWTVGVDATVARGHQPAAGARHAPPKDIPAERLAPLLCDPPPAPEPPPEPAAPLTPRTAQGAGSNDTNPALAGGKRADREGLGRSRGGLSTFT